MQGGYLSSWCFSCCGLFRSGWDVVPKLLLLEFILSKLSFFFFAAAVYHHYQYFCLDLGVWNLEMLLLVHSESLTVIPGTFSLGRKCRAQGGDGVGERLCWGIALCREVWGYPRFLWKAPWLSRALFQRWQRAQLPLIVFDLQPFVWGCKGGKGSFKKGGAAGSPNSSGEESSPLGFRGQEGLRDQESLLESGFFSPCAAGGRCQGAAAEIWGRGGFFLPCSGGQPSSQVWFNHVASSSVPGSGTRRGLGDSWPKPEGCGSAPGIGITSSPGCWQGRGWGGI